MSGWPRLGFNQDSRSFARPPVSAAQIDGCPARTAEFAREASRASAAACRRPPVPRRGASRPGPGFPASPALFLDVGPHPCAAYGVLAAESALVPAVAVLTYRVAAGSAFPGEDAFRYGGHFADDGAARGGNGLSFALHAVDCCLDLLSGVDVRRRSPAIPFFSAVRLHGCAPSAPLDGGSLKPLWRTAGEHDHARCGSVSHRG